MSTVYVVGLGPGAEERMTVRAQKSIGALPCFDWLQCLY